MKLMRMLPIAAIALVSVTGALAEDEPSSADQDAQHWSKQVSVKWNHVDVQAARQIGEASTSRYIHLVGAVQLLDDDSVLGICNEALLDEAVDADGNVLAKIDGPKQQELRARQHHYSFPRGLPDYPPGNGKLDVTRLNMTVPLNGQPFPSKVRLVSGKLRLLVGKVSRKDIALEKNEELTELAPGLSIRVAGTNVRGGATSYHLRVEGTEADRRFDGWIGPNYPLPKAYILKGALVDTGGEEHPMGGTVTSQIISGSIKAGENFRTLRTVRVQSASEIREVDVPIEVRDLEMPVVAQK